MRCGPINHALALLSWRDETGNDGLPALAERYITEMSAARDLHTTLPEDDDGPDDLWDASCALLNRVAKQDAQSLAGLVAKARVLRVATSDNPRELAMAAACDLALSLARNTMQLAGAADGVAHTGWPG